jgi:hypothetical protein
MRKVQILVTSALFALLLAGTSILAQQDQTQSGPGDPVADAARKAREAKKTAPKPKKVFTNDDISSKPAAEAPAPATSAASQGSATTTPPEAPAKQAKAATGPAEDPNSEAAWRKRFAAQRRKISDAEEELSVLQREAAKADLQYYSDPQKAMNEQFTRNEINEKNEKIAAKKKQIEDLKQQLSDMEDQLRAAGGDAGWAR